jgi:parallel beta-helix repeat protein
LVNGILVAASSNNTIIGNNIAKNAYGLWINQFSVYNNVTGNNITGNEIGIMIEASLNNTIYSNNLDNQKQVDIKDTLADNVISINIWDNGKDGNYWSDYTGTDSHGDGKGDTPYVIDENNQDNFPLMEQFIIPEFPSWIILPLLLTATVVVIICKQRLTKTPSGQ